MVLSLCKQLSEHSRDTKLKNIQQLVHICYVLHHNKQHKQ